MKDELMIISFDTTEKDYLVVQEIEDILKKHKFQYTFSNVPTENTK